MVRPNVKTYVLWIYQKIKRRFPLILALTLLSIAVSFSGICFVYFTKELVNSAVAANGHQLRLAGALMISLSLFQVLGNLILRYFSANVQEGLERDMKRSVLSTILRSEYSAISRHHSSDLIQRMDSDGGNILQGGTRDRLENAAFQGASAGVRYLFPFVDHRVMDFAVSIPRHLYVSDKETRVIYRNAFADLMPESLRRVSYKAMVSLRHIGSRNMDHDAYVINREYIVNKLDPEYWRGILDLEAIARREQPQDPQSDEARAFRMDTHMLYRCILIQNTAKLAKDWRTIHDRTDLL